MRYRNEQWGYELELPSGWHTPGIIRRIIHPGRHSSQNAHPTFYGPGNVKLKISSGHAGFQNLELVVERAGHNVLNLGTIVTGGKSHDTVLCDVPGAGRLKNYAIRFEGIEHLITTDAPERVGDSIVSTFSVHSSSEDEARTREAAPFENGFQLADWSFRTATLLYELLVRGGKAENDKRFLIQTGFSWIRSEVPEKILTGLNVLRFLVRAKDVQDSPEFQDEVVRIFIAGGPPGVSKIVVRPAIRLAALDLLANTRILPNPVTKLPNVEAGELRNFRTEFMKNFNKSQHEYKEKNHPYGSPGGVFRKDLQRCNEVCRLESLNLALVKITRSDVTCPTIHSIS
jgi:hypothetical protein